MLSSISMRLSLTSEQSNQGKQNDSKEAGSLSKSRKSQLCQDTGHQPGSSTPAHVHTEQSTLRQVKYLLEKSKILILFWKLKVFLGSSTCSRLKLGAILLMNLKVPHCFHYLRFHFYFQICIQQLLLMCICNTGVFQIVFN